MVAHTLEQQANAMFLVGDPRALSCALEALERCERLEPPAPMLRASVLSLLGSIHLRGHDWNNAARFFEMGLATSEGLVSLHITARLHDGLTAAYQELGDRSRALRSAERAFALYEVDADVTTLIRAENNLGYALLQQGELEPATRHLHRALELCEQHEVHPLARAYVLNSVGELHLARGEPDVAQTHLQRSLDVTEALGERATEATARHLLGRASERLGRDDAADRWFRSAIELLDRLELTERLRVCATEYAELLYRMDRTDESVRFWRVAAGAARRPVQGVAVDEVGMRGLTNVSA